MQTDIIDLRIKAHALLNNCPCITILTTHDYDLINSLETLAKLLKEFPKIVRVIAFALNPTGRSKASAKCSLISEGFSCRDNFIHSTKHDFIKNFLFVI